MSLSSPFFRAVLGAALILTAARAGWAHEVEPAARAAAPAVVPPRPITPLRADYPEGARGDASVVLVLTVNADGTVRAASASEGPEPFASAAVAAASTFRFAPATVEGAPVASKIRVEVHFTAPTNGDAATTPSATSNSDAATTPSATANSDAATTPSATANGPRAAPPARTAPAGSPSPSSQRPTPTAPIEVTVRGDPAPPSGARLGRAEIRLLPGAFGDPFRAVEALPGVTPIASGAPFFYVRGAPPGNVGYFLDGIRIPLLYHIGLGPSVVPPAIVDRVDLHPGGYPARFGRFTGGVVAGETRPPRGEAHGEGVLRLVDAGALVEAPFDGGRGAALAGARYSYTAPLLSLFAPDTSLSYWDYQARVGYDLTPRDRVSVFAFGAYDFLGERDDDAPADGIRTVFSAMFHRLDLRYQRSLGEGSSLRHAVTLGYDVTQLDGERDATERMLALRAELDHEIGDAARLRTGVDAALEDGEMALRAGDHDDPILSLFTTSSRRDASVGAFVEADLDVTPRLRISPGLRLDVMSAERALWFSIEPRIASQLTITPRVRFVHAHGLAAQPPSFLVPAPGVRPPRDEGLQRSLQSSAGVEVDLPEDVEAKLTLFSSAFFDMTDALGTTDISLGPPRGALERRSLGSSAGLELSLRRPLTRRLGGFLAYTLSRSSRAFGRFNVPSSFDRTHVLNLAASYNLGRGYRAGSRFLFYTGTPSNTGLPSRTHPGLSAPAPGRRPSFFRLDVRAEKRWAIGRTGWLSVVLEVLNATLSKELIGYDCSTGRCEAEWLGPVTIPSLGLEGGF